MEAFLKNAFKNIFLILFFLFVGIVTEFHWIFWVFVLTCIHKPLIDAAAHSINSLTEKLRQNRLKNHPPQ